MTATDDTWPPMTQTAEVGLVDGPGNPRLAGQDLRGSSFGQFLQRRTRLLLPTDLESVEAKVD